MNKETYSDLNLQSLIDAFNTGLITPIKELIQEYRLYYDNEGEVIQTSDSNWNHPESGNYVIVDQHIYKNWSKYRIRNGQPVLKPTDPTSERQLKKSTTGYLVVKNNPAILIEAGELIENTEYYDRRYN